MGVTSQNISPSIDTYVPVGVLPREVLPLLAGYQCPLDWLDQAPPTLVVQHLQRNSKYTKVTKSKGYNTLILFELQRLLKQ